MKINLEKYAATIVEEMDMDTLVSYATDMIIEKLKNMSEQDLLRDVEESGHTPEEFTE